MIKFVSLYTHTNTDASLCSFLSVVWIVYFRLETLFFFERVHLEWTYSQVPSRVYYSSGVGLRLLVRLAKSSITKGPHRYVWSETRHVSVWTWWGGPRKDSSKPRCFWRIFTLSTTVTKTDTDTLSRFLVLNASRRDMFLTQKKTGGNPVRIANGHEIVNRESNSLKPRDLRLGRQ